MSYQKYYVKDVKEKSSEKLFNVISCFAGGGGSSTGYRLAGANILLINEFVEGGAIFLLASLTYLMNVFQGEAIS